MISKTWLVLPADLEYWAGHMLGKENIYYSENDADKKASSATIADKRAYTVYEAKRVYSPPNTPVTCEELK